MVVSLSDNELLLKWKEGNEQAFGQLYKKYLKELLQIAYYKTGDFETSKEIVQDVFLKLYDKKDKVNNNPLLYLKEILKYKILEHHKSYGKIAIVNVETVPEELQLSDNPVWENITNKETLNHISKVIDNMPERQREIFLMNREKNMTYPEIAKQLEISVKTVEAHISKALKYLREHLDYQFFWAMALMYWLK